MAGLIARLIRQDGDEQVGDAGGTDVAERGQPLTIDSAELSIVELEIEEQDAAAHCLALVASD